MRDFLEELGGHLLLLAIWGAVLFITGDELLAWGVLALLWVVFIAVIIVVKRKNILFFVSNKRMKKEKENSCAKKLFQFFRQMPWQDNMSDVTVLVKGREAFEDIIKEENYTKKPLLYRLAGQSGTGKTTQLLPAVLECERQRGNNPVVVAVRRFAKYHPNYNQLKNDKECREKTNGFALKCLSATLQLLIENGYLVVLDMTILHPDFEAFVLSLLQKHGYTTQYQIMAVNMQISEKLVAKRTSAASGSEGGRIVKPETADYFNAVLPAGLEFLSSADGESLSFVWTVFDKEPIYIGKLSGVMTPFEKGRGKMQEFVVAEEELRQAKKTCIQGFLPL